MSVLEIVADPELEAMIAITRVASARARERYAAHLVEAVVVDEKSPGDPVTEVDRELDQMICTALAGRFPEAAVVGEESSSESAADTARRLAAERVFFVDPIDGTREFVKKTAEFAVMVGLAVRGRAVAGVVALPTEGLVLAGRVGQRAFVEREDRSRSFIGVSAVAAFADATMHVSRGHTPEIAEPLRHRLGVMRVLPCGSVGVKVARIAMGSAEIYVHAGPGAGRWDTCAPEAIVLAAGGRLTDLDGGLIPYGAPDLKLRRGIVVTNGVLHAGVMSAVAWAEREVRRLG
ncbi:MAG: 3'(2'),5'-bisphosphate nucleotidase CysQ [Myxococcales bacterium]|nr:3'(2'),5'-bisphosphate nucleotidase CysQ [Myxococcales bacterium]